MTITVEQIRMDAYRLDIYEDEGKYGYEIATPSISESVWIHARADWNTRLEAECAGRAQIRRVLRLRTKTARAA